MSFYESCLRRIRLNVLLLLAFLHAAPEVVTADDATSVSKADFLAFLKGVEASSGGYRWHFRFLSRREGRERPSMIEGDVTFDVAGKFYKFEGASVLDWRNGAADRCARRFGMSYDGTLYRYWSHFAYGETLPPVIADPDAGIEGTSLHEIAQSVTQARPSGVIDVKEQRESAFANYKAASGVDLFPSSVGLAVRRTLGASTDADFSSVIADCEESCLKITLDRDRRFYTVTITPPSIQYGEVRFELDAQLNGMLRLVRHTVRTKAGAEILFEQKVLYNDDGGVPRSIEAIDGTNRIEVELTQFEVIDAVDRSDFGLRFPLGTNLVDRVKGERSTVGQDLASQSQAVRK